MPYFETRETDWMPQSMIAGLQKDINDMKIKHLELQRTVRALYFVDLLFCCLD